MSSPILTSNDEVVGHKRPDPQPDTLPPPMPTIHYDCAVYKADCTELPIELPFGYPHILADADTTKAAVQRGKLVCHVADGVATVLYHYNRETLRAFFNPCVVDFQFKHLKAKGGFSGTCDLLIRREKSTVTSAFCKDLPDGSQKFECKYVYHVSQSGLWEPVLGIFSVLPPLVATDRLEWAEKNTTMGYFGAQFALDIIRRELWQAKDGGSITVTLKVEPPPIETETPT